MTSRLTASEVLVVDCQSTGSTPAHGHLIELGWARFACDVADVAVGARVVALPEGASLPRMVSRITGLTPADVRTGVPIEAAWRELDGAARAVRATTARPHTPTVIHFAQFEERFLRDLYERHDDAPWFRFDIVCTHAIAARLFPALPRRSLRALAGYFGYSSTHLRRSGDHVAATCFVWQKLVATLEHQHDVCTWDELRAWLEETPRPGRTKRAYPMAAKKRLALPDGPGVYRFLRSNGDLLYVGKATSLKKRVNGHFVKKPKLPERTLEMLTQARDLDFTETATPLEAALLESDEIKARRPPYNVALLEEGRRVWFAARDLSSFVDTPDDDHPIGPLPSRRALEGLRTILALLGEPATEPSPYVMARALGIMPVSAPDAACFLGGFERFRAANALGPHTDRRTLFRLARAIAERLLREPRVRREEEALTWDVERVHEHLDEALARTPQLVARARWICHLAESVVDFVEPSGAARRLVVTRGRVTACEDVGALPVSPSRLERQRDLDIVAYDRLRVLTTELKRIHRDGGTVKIVFQRGAPLIAPALDRALRAL